MERSLSPKHTRLSRLTGRRVSVTACTEPRNSPIQERISPTLETVAERQTNRTAGGAWMITSSQTGTAVGVLEVVHLVQDDPGQLVQIR